MNGRFRNPAARVLKAGLAMGLVLLVGGCSEESVVAVDVASVAVSPNEAVVTVGETHRFSATPRDASGNALPGRSIQWSSTATAVAAVNGDGLAEGRAPGTAEIQASVGGVTGSASLLVEERPRLALAPSQVTFEADAGGPAEPRTVEVTNGGGGSLTDLAVSVAHPSDEPDGWLAADLDGTQAPTSIRLSATAEALDPGSFSARVEVTAPGADNSPQAVEVRLEVGAGPPSIRLSSTALGFSSEVGEPPPSSQTVTVTNAGEGELTGIDFAISYEPDDPDGWLSVEADGTTAPVELTVQPDADGLSTGEYDAFVDVSSPVAVNSPVRIRVRFTVGSEPPRIDLDPTAVSFQVEEDESPGPSGTVSVENSGTGQLGGLAATISFDPGDVGEWATVSLAGTSAPTTLSVTVVETSLAPGEYGARVTVSSPDAVNSPQTLEVTLDVLPRPSGQESEITADPEEIQVGGETSTITVQLRDPRGDPLEFGGAVVKLETTAGSLSDVTDNGDGTYTATLTSSILPDTATVTGIVDGRDIQDSAEVVFVVGPLSLTESTVAADPTQLTADGESTSTVTVTLLDEHGNTITDGNLQVTLDPEWEGGTGELGEMAFDENAGVYRATLIAPIEVGSVTLRARVDGDLIEDSATVEFAVGSVSAETSSVEADPSSGVTADGETPSTVTIQLRDAQGNAIGGLEAGDFGVDVTGDASAGTVSETSTAGTYEVEVTNTTAETVTVTVTADGVTLDDPPTIEFVAANADAVSIVSGDNQSGTVGEELLNPFGVRVVDAFDNPVPGHAVSFAIVDTPDGAGGQSLSTTVTTTDGDGEAQTTLTLGDEPGTYTVEATPDDELTGSPAIFEATAEAGAAAAIVFTTSPKTITAGQTSDLLAVQLQDGNGNTATSDGETQIDLTTNRGGTFRNSVDDADITSVTIADGSSEASFRYTSTQADVHTLTASAAGLAAATQDLTVEAATAAAVEAISDHSVSGTVNSTVDPFVVRVIDEFDNPVSGHAVSWAIIDTPDGASGQSLSDATTTTDGDGEAQTTLTLGDEPGTYSVEATPDEELTGSPVTFEATATGDG